MALFYSSSEDVEEKKHTNFAIIINDIRQTTWERSKRSIEFSFDQNTMEIQDLLDAHASLNARKAILSDVEENQYSVTNEVYLN